MEKTAHPTRAAHWPGQGGPRSGRPHRRRAARTGRIYATGNDVRASSAQACDLDPRSSTCPHSIAIMRRFGYGSKEEPYINVLGQEGALAQAKPKSLKITESSFHTHLWGFPACPPIFFFACAKAPSCPGTLKFSRCLSAPSDIEVSISSRATARVAMQLGADNE